MTTPPTRSPEDVITRLQELVAKWRESAAFEYDDMGNKEYASALDQCADELNTLLSPLSGTEGRPEWQPQTPEQKATNRRLTRLFNGGCDVCVVSQHCERAGRCLAECSPDDLSPPDALGPAEEPKQ